MANNLNTPSWLEDVRERKAVCVYCGTEFTASKISKKTAAT